MSEAQQAGIPTEEELEMMLKRQGFSKFSGVKA